MTNTNTNRNTRMTYNDFITQIAETRRDLELATTQDEINYFGLQLMVLEDRLETIIDRGRE